MSKWYAAALMIAGSVECVFSLFARATLAPPSVLWQQLLLGSFLLGMVLAAWGIAGLLVMALARAVAPEPPLVEAVELEEDVSL